MNKIQVHQKYPEKEMERLYADWIDDCETSGEKFVDAEFRIEDARNFGAKDAKYRRLPKKSKFIVDGIDALDVNQVRIKVLFWIYPEYIYSGVGVLWDTYFSPPLWLKKTEVHTF